MTNANGFESPSSLRSSRLGSRRNSLAESVNHVLHFKEESSIRRSIGGRLGSSIRSTTVPLKDLLLLQDDDEELSKESTPLIRGKETQDDVGHLALVVWIFPALACAAAYAFYNIFIKKGSYSIHPILGGVVLQFVAAILGTVLMGGIVLTHGAKSVMQYDQQGLQWAVCAGLAVGLAEMLSFVVNGMGVAATQSIPVIIGGSVMFGAVMGIVLLHEVLMLHGWSGVAMLVLGIALVATDPGDKATEGGGDTTAAPSLVIWIGPALVCASAYALYNIFIKLGSASINPILGGVILQFVAAVFGTVLLMLLSLYEGGTDYLNWDLDGLLWSCCAGLAVGAAEMLSFVVSGLGVPATHSIPVIIGGSTFFGALLGLMMLGEALMLQGWCGVALLTIGIGVVATDPGDKLEGH